MLKASECKPGTTAFCFENKQTLLSYRATSKKKMVLVLSSMHNQPIINSTGKPEMIHYYNTTKGAVDTFDQMCGIHSTSSKTRRWPLCMFYRILNAATINAYVIYTKNN